MTGQKLSVTQWFAVAVGLLALVATAGLIAGLLALERQSEARSLLLDRVDPAEAAALRLEAALIDQETGVRGFALTGDEGYLDPYRAGRREEGAIVPELRRLEAVEELAPLRAELAAVEEAAAAWRADYAEPALAAVRAGEEPPSEALGRARFDAVRAALASQQLRVDNAQRTGVADLDEAAERSQTFFILSGVLALLATALAGLVLRRVVLRPLAQLAHDVREVAQGDFDRPVKGSGAREIAELGADVDAMRARIAAEVAALRDAEIALIDQARELQRSNEELEQFAYVASHDLQEPLRKVASFTQMLQRRYEGQLDERADRYIEFAVDGARRMQDLINDLLAFSRVGRMTRPHERVRVRDLVDAAEARLAALLEDTGGEVVVHGELPEVVGDEGLLTTVFQNLIGNGLKFRGEAPPRVELEAARDGAAWRFTITDNGIGIEDEYAERIFVIFQRLHTRDTYEGTGIGLAMCRKIIEYHGGRIALAPAEPGRGARFTFTLPAADHEEETA